MVRYSKVSMSNPAEYVSSLTDMCPQLAFRQTVHAYGTDLCWTPMILAKEFNRSSVARASGEFLGNRRALSRSDDL